MSKKICVVGAGYWGKNHISTLAKLGALYGVVDKNRDTLDSLIIKYPNIKKHSTIEDAFLEDYDAFTIATPAETHFRIAKMILLNNYHVLIEKPMTLSIKEAETLVRISKENKAHIVVGHVLLFHPAINKIKELIEKNRIGQLQYIYSNRLNLGKVRTEENVFWSLAPHDVAIFQYLTNSFPKGIYTKGSTFLQRNIPDSTVTYLEYENGVEGHIFVSWLHPFKEHRLVVIGSNAMISFEDSKEEKPLKLYSKKFDLVNGVPEKVDGSVKSISYEKKLPLEEEMKYFINTITINKSPEISSGKHGLEVIKILVSAGKQLL